ncbi:MAG: extensin family protein [Rhizobiaceae bacterium]|nr:extensin family protein [Rhizobiaceae bacterium]
MSFPESGPEQPVVLGAPERQLAQAFPPIENPAQTLNDSSPQPEFDQEPDVPMVAEPEEEPEIVEPAAPRATLVAYPRVPSPMPPEPEMAPMRPRAAPLSASELACRQSLKKLGVRYVDLKPINDSASCRIPYPVKLQAIGSVEMRPAATLTCSMALAFAEWTRKELVPSSRMRYFSGIKTIHQGSAYSCRRIARSRTMSAHSQGNALDVMALTLNNGKKIAVKKQGLFAFRARGLLNNVRSDGCEYFTTVLGPGYNWDHRDHFHFDLMQRRNGRRACH